jgi:thioredoxin reductase (NADPH)
VVFFPDGSWLVQPDLDQLAEKVGLQQQAEHRFYDLVVVGGGPAGLSAAVYGASEGLNTLLLESEAPGGQAGASARIDNYLGFPSGLSGNELTRRAVAQARRFGVEILMPQKATGVRIKGRYRLIELQDGLEVACHAILIAAGVSYRDLEVPGMAELAGAGVFYGAVITEAISCQGKEVFILGGGNSAGQAALYLSRFASQISIVTIEDSLNSSMSRYLIDQIEDAGNIHVRTGSTVTAVQGQDHLESLTLLNQKTGQHETVSAVALFIYIGATPRTDWLGDLLERDEQGYLLTGPDLEGREKDMVRWTLSRKPYFLESSVPGIFVAGDIRHGSVKRIASAVGEGAMAVTFIHQYLTG